MIIGIPGNPYAPNVPACLLAAAGAQALPARPIDLPTLRLSIAATGVMTAADRNGTVLVDVLSPYLLFGAPAAAHALRAIERTARALNQVAAVELADDKAATALHLARAGVAQVPTEVVAQELAELTAAADRLGYPVVVKRTHGAQGRWVRRAGGPDALPGVLVDLAVEGPGALLVQPEITECRGRSIRAVVTGGALLAATERFADAGEWRSNIAQGGRQRPVDLTPAERQVAATAAAALGLGHAGVDLLRTSAGPRVLEVNACPDFTSMQPYVAIDLGAAVLAASVQASAAGCAQQAPGVGGRDH